MQQRFLVLASTSSRRHELLARLGVPFAVLDPAVEEPEPAPQAEASAYAVEMARLKAEAALAQLRRDGVPEAARQAEWLDVLTSDTTVALETEILGKPADREDALRILGRLSGSAHRVISSVSLRTFEPASGRVVEALDTADETGIRFRPLSDAEIRAYVDSGECFGKAGAYAVQESGDRFVEALDGRFSTVVGLPLALVAAVLRERGYAVPEPEELEERLDRRIEGR